jgi:HK97 family phage major capsid protein
MDLLTRSQLKKAGTLILDAARDGEVDEEQKSCLGFLDLSRKEIHKYSILRAIVAKYESIMRLAGQLGGPGFCGLEHECHEALAAKLGQPEHQGRIYIPSDILYRDLSVGSAGGGGYLVGTAIGSFIDMLRNRSVVFRMGAQRAPGQVDNLVWAKQTGGSTVVWLSTEASTATESTPSFVQIAATPKTAIAYNELSRQLTKQVTPAGEQLYLGALAKDMALAADQAVLNGSGAAGQPTGIIGTSGIGGVIGTSIDYTKQVEFQTDVSDANGALNPATMGYVTTPTVAALLKGRQRFTGTDSPLWRGSIVEGEIEGNRGMSSKQMPTAPLLYGDWSAVTVPEWGVLAVEVNPFQDFQKGIIGVRALWSLDVLVQFPSAFSLATSIT